MEPTTAVDFEHGQPIRSNDLNQRFQAAELNQRRALLRADRLEERTRMVELALHAQSAPARVDPTASAITGVRLPLVPGPDAEMIGPMVVTRRSESRPSLGLYDPISNNVNPNATPGSGLWSPTGGVLASGESVLLEEGAIWARLTNSPVDTFMAHIEPSRLSFYNELLVPIVAGSITVQLGKSTGQPAVFQNITRTSVFRFAAEQEFNGRVTVISESAAGLGGRQIHTLGGLHIRRSTWEQRASAQASYRIPEDGVWNFSRVLLLPSGRQASFTVYKDGDPQPANAVTADAGDILTIEVDLHWNSPASQVEVIANLVT